MRSRRLRLTRNAREAWLAAALGVAACQRGTSPKEGALAGFEGRITLHTSEAGKPDADFRITAKGGTLRIDVPPPEHEPAAAEVTLGHAVYERSTSHALIFFDSTKEYRQMDLSKRIAPDPSSGPAVARTGEHKIIAGVACDEASVKGTDGGRTDVCLADGLAYLEIFRVQFGPKGTESPLAREFREHATFPMERAEYDASGKELARMVVTRVEPGAIDDAAFAVPADYKKVDPHFAGPGPSGSSRSK